jgi:hypothetical protein
MSGGISIGFVDFPDLLFDFVHVRRVSISLLLVGNWCGPRPTVEISAGLGFGRRRFRCRTRCGNHLLKLRLSARDPMETSLRRVATLFREIAERKPHQV